MSRLVAVSGSASGVGAALVALLRERGDTVIGVDRNEAEVQADLSTPDGRAAAVDAVLARTGGKLDAVVASAGLTGGDPAVVKVNFFGAVELLDGLRPALAASSAPRAAVVSSISSTQPFDAELLAACLDRDEERAVARAGQVTADGRGSQVYSSSKVALSQWVRATSVRDDWARAGIPLNAVAPGVVLTPMTEGLFEDEAMKAVMDRAVPMPLNGYSGPEVIAKALAWFVSVDNTHATGQVLFVDGGAEAINRGSERF